MREADRGKKTGDAGAVDHDIDIQDILSINLERAVQVSVDIGAHLITDLSVPPPKTMGDVFAILAAEKLIPEGNERGAA